MFDSDRGLNGSPSTKLLNGRESTFRLGYNVAAPQDLVLELTPGFEYDSVIFATQS